MVDLKLKKLNWQRRRFIRSESATPLSNCSDVFEDLKSQILTESVFQLVGRKAIVEVDRKSGQGHVLVEVLGIPKAGFLSFDMEECEVLVYDSKISAFDVDFMTLSLEALAIMNKIPQALGPTYHIVLDGDHLALHFFIQKDYIQS